MTSDRELGMGAGISRRDFVNGIAVAVGTAGSASAVRAAGAMKPAGPVTNYPPRKQGMRGSHPGSFESAHALRDGTLDPKSSFDTRESYDLVIVGGGLSGLAAAHFFLKDVGPGARVLILDNHDDFGGHAKRNEFSVDGKLLVVNGGTLNVESPQRYNRWARHVLDDIGVDLDRYKVENSSNKALYTSLGLGHATFFDKQTWGADTLVKAGKSRRAYSPEFIAQAPLSAKAKADFLRLTAETQPDYLKGMSIEQKKQYLATTSFADYYLKNVGVDPQVLWFFQTMGHGSFCVGADATPALFGWVQDYPGFSGLGLGPIPDNLFADLPGGQHGRQKESDSAIHFPDGNATLARLLVASLIPNATKGRSMDDMGLAEFDYGQLDRSGQSARIRLSSIVVNVRHDGDPATASEAIVTYVNGGKLQHVRGKAVIMASWNMMIPYIVPDMPAKQREALAYGVKGPLIYTNVALRNWKAFEKLGIDWVDTPTMFHESMELTEAASLGALRHPQTPDQPIIAHFVKIMAVPGLPRRDQHRVGRAQLLETSFETFERETREQMTRILAPGGFDPARDIAGVTVNRWPHGYAYTYNSLFDPVEWVYTETPTRPCVVGRQPWGLISIANADAAASPHTDAAFLEGHRAAAEVVERRMYPFVRRA